jgi:hypothetical protein
MSIASKSGGKSITLLEITGTDISIDDKGCYTCNIDAEGSPYSLSSLR